MSALAQYLRFQGIAVSGSDRLHASEDTASIRQVARRARVHHRSAGRVGSGRGHRCRLRLDGDRGLQSRHRRGPRAAAFPSSTAPTCWPPSSTTKRTIAVAGTSGKSTVTAMIFEFLTACGKSPSLISGAGLRRLEKQGLIGNAYSGGSDLLVVEADESDGTLVKYRPEAAVILNVSKDHKSIDEITKLFETLASQSAWTASNADDPVLASLPATVRFGRNGSGSWRPDREELLPTSVKLFRARYRIPSAPSRASTTSRTCARRSACASISDASPRACGRGKELRGRGPAFFRDRDKAERPRGRRLRPQPGQDSGSRSRGAGPFRTASSPSTSRTGSVRRGS